MKPIQTAIFLALLTGCAHQPSQDFVQGNLRITPPIQQDALSYALLSDGGTQPGRFTDARGRVFEFFIDHHIGTKTPGAIYLNAYPGEPHSVQVKNEAEFRQKLGFNVN